MARKILYSLVPLTLGSLFLLGLSNYYAARNQILAGVDRQIGALAQQAGDNLAAFFDLRQDDALTLAKSSLLRDYLKYQSYGLKEESEAYRKELAQYYSRFAREKGVYFRIAYCDTAGRELAAGARDETSAAFDPIALPLPPPGQVFHSELKSGDAKEIAYWAGVYDDQDRPQGIVKLDCDLAQVRRVLTQVSIGENGRAFLVDPRGGELLSSRKPFAPAIAGEAAIRGTPWKIRLMAKPEEFLAPLRKVTDWTIFLSLSAMILTLFWVGYLIRSAVRPISDMAEGTKRLAMGDLDFRFDPPRVLELRILGDAFNEMAGSLKERNLLLEARIQELLALRDMETAVLQRLDEDKILRVCLKSIAEGLGFDRTGLYWVDAAKRETVGRYMHTRSADILSEQSFRRRRIPFGEDDILNQVVGTRTAVFVAEPEKDSRLNPDYVKEAGTREFLMAPICGKDRVFGVFVADNRLSARPLKATDKDGLMVFANAVGLALENATLFEHLAESEARYRAVLDNSPEAVLGLSREQWITTWNKGAEAIFGYSESEIVGKPLTALFPPEAEPGVQRLVSLVMEKGSARDFPMPGKARGGGKLELSLSWGGSQPDFWMNKEWTVVIRDVTDAKRLQRQLIQSEKLSAVGQLISGIAHELNNPLQAVTGYAQFLAAADKHLKAKDEMRQILESALRCRKIIENLLVFVRQGKVEKKPVSVPKLVRASLDLLEYKLKKADSVKVSVRLARGLPPVKGDSQQLQQVLVNLVNNACDAMSGQKGAKAILVEASAAAGVVRLSLSDTGPGISPEHLARIFEPFFTTKGEGRGTGLGLPICRQIVEEHGGRLECSSRVGEGTTFYFELPAADAKVSAAPKAAALPRSAPGRAVLLVDDEPAVLALLSKVFSAEGHRVETASSVAAAAAKAKLKSFDLVVTDVHLGDGSGLEFYEGWALPHPRPPFLFVTGDALDTALEPTFSAKGLILLFKPMDLDVLTRAARALLKSKRPAGSAALKSGR